MAFDLGLVEDAYTAALSNPQHDMVEEKVRRLVLALVEQGGAHMNTHMHMHVCRQVHAQGLSTGIMYETGVWLCSSSRRLGPGWCGSVLTLAVLLCARRSAAAAAQPALGWRAGTEAGQLDRASACCGGVFPAALPLGCMLVCLLGGQLIGATCDKRQWWPLLAVPCLHACDHSSNHLSARPQHSELSCCC
jgi:hypothetical protein